MLKLFEAVGSAFPLLFIFALADACPAQGGVTWQQAYPGTPSTWIGHAMAYDAARQRAVLFGGKYGSNLLSDTWKWDGIDWLRAAPTLAPSARQGHAMAYDAARRRVVLFGGATGTTYLSDTWEWDGVNWTQATPAQSPSSRTGHAMAYDASRQRVVLFGGGSDPFLPSLSDTWEWDGVNWAQVTPAQSPSARTGHAMAYDTARQRMVLFGGWDPFGLVLFLDTWEWDGVNWAQVTPAQSPSARTGHAMAYDTARQRVVLFGGEGWAASGWPQDTWEWDGVNWTQAAPAQSPAPRVSHAMAYDTARQRVVLFGGEGVAASGWPQDTWEWDGVNWTQVAAAQGPSARVGHAMAYYASRQRVVLFGGGDVSGLLSDTWEWDGLNWTQPIPSQSPGARSGHAMAYDAVRQRVVLFGGHDWSGPGDLGDTWEWDGVNWTQVTPAQSPSARNHHAMAYDRARQRVMLFGGGDSLGNLAANTWEWDGVNWAQVTPAQSPSARTGHAMAYDTARQRVVLFGGRDSLGNFPAGTWEWDGVNWAQVTPVQSPPARSGHAMAYDTARQRVVLFGGPNWPAVFQDTWEWDGMDWTQATPAQSPSTRGVMAYDVARQRLVLSGGELGGSLSETWEYSSLSPTAFTTFGTGCPGTTGVPSLDAAPFSSPWTGDNFSLELSNLPPGAMTFMVTGLSNTFWSGALLSLPAPLTSWGMPGCTVYTDVLDSELLANTGGTAVWTKTIPVDPLLVGLTFYNQGFVIDPGVNAMGATVSNAGAATIGMR